MGNVNDSSAIATKTGDDGEQVVDFAVGERGSRLIHDQDLRVGPDRPGDFDDLLFRHAERGYAAIRINSSPDALDQFDGAAIALLPVHFSPRAAAFEGQGDVFGDAEIRK
jgi:hypothetical protein